MTPHFSEILSLFRLLHAFCLARSQIGYHTGQGVSCEGIEGKIRREMFFPTEEFGRKRNFPTILHRYPLRSHRILLFTNWAKYRTSRLDGLFVYYSHSLTPHHQEHSTSNSRKRGERVCRTGWFPNPHTQPRTNVNLRINLNFVFYILLYANNGDVME